jgi:hypothetical protein
MLRIGSKGPKHEIFVAEFSDNPSQHVYITYKLGYLINFLMFGPDICDFVF